MPTESEKLTQLLIYKNIENHFHVGLVPAFEYVLRLMPTDEFDETYEFFSLLCRTGASFLRHIRKRLEIPSDLSLMECEEYIERLSKKLSDREE